MLNPWGKNLFPINITANTIKGLVKRDKKRKLPSSLIQSPLFLFDLEKYPVKLSMSIKKISMPITRATSKLGMPNKGLSIIDLKIENYLQIILPVRQ